MAPRDNARGLGLCGSPSLPKIARAAPHFGEEPCISGTHGSGTVFFSGCNLRCIFCQNAEISRGGVGKTVSVERLREIFIELREKGVHNINLVTPSHYVRAIVCALDGMTPGIPVAYNSSGYDSLKALSLLSGKVQIYMPDFKYALPGPAGRYSAAPDYVGVAKAAIEAMYRQVGPFELDESGIMQSGVLIRHLILPGNLENTFAAIDWVAAAFPPGSVMFSLMSQYTPIRGPRLPAELSRTLTPEEHGAAVAYLEDSGIEAGFYQELSSATDELIPDFDGSGV